MKDNSNHLKNVISLSRVQSDQRFPVISAVEAYWTALRGGRSVPFRFDIDPRGIEHALEYTFMLERIAPGIARLRFAGSHLNDLMGMEVRGMPLSALFAGGARAAITDTLEQVFSTPAIADLTLRYAGRFGVSPLDARMVILPLQSADGQIDRAMGCLISNGTIPSGACRFDITDTRTTHLPPHISAAPRPRMAFAEAQAPFAPQRSARIAKGPNTTRPALRLVTFDD